MKRVTPYAFIFPALISCSTKPSDTTAVQDTTQVAVVENTTAPADPATPALSEEQLQLNAMISDFNDVKPSLSRVIYNEHNEYDEKTQTYYYQGKNLRYVESILSAEGGHEEKLIVKVDADFEVVLSTTNNASGQSAYDADGYFSYVKNGEPTAFLVTLQNNETPIIKGPTDVQSSTYSNELSAHLESIKTNRQQFTLSEDDGTYVYFIERKKVDSEYGETEVSKSYRVDKSLFEKGILF